MRAHQLWLSNFSDSHPKYRQSVLMRTFAPRLGSRLIGLRSFCFYSVIGGSRSIGRIRRGRGLILPEDKPTFSISRMHRSAAFSIRQIGLRATSPRLSMTTLISRQWLCFTRRRPTQKRRCTYQKACEHLKNEFLELAPLGIVATPGCHFASLPLGLASRNIGKKLRCRLSLRTSPMPMAFALRRSPPPGVITAMSGFSIIAR